MRKLLRFLLPVAVLVLALSFGRDSRVAAQATNAPQPVNIVAGGLTHMNVPPTQHVLLRGNSTDQLVDIQFHMIANDGTNGPLQVPAGHALVITDVFWNVPLAEHEGGMTLARWIPQQNTIQGLVRASGPAGPLGGIGSKHFTGGVVFINSIPAGYRIGGTAINSTFELLGYFVKLP
jgi:hypothetical protein